MVRAGWGALAGGRDAGRAVCETRPMSDRVTVSVDAGVADVRLNRPEKRNALDGAMFLALAEAGERMKTEPGLRCVVLSGEGPSFCAGLDFGSFQQMSDGDRPEGERPAGNPWARGDARTP